MQAPHHSLMQALAANANDSGPALEVLADPSAPGGLQVAYLRPEELPGFAQTMVVVRTSGSTGRAKRTVLSVSAMAASAQATAEYLGFEGQWLLALPVHYVAGLSVLTRSLFAGTNPVSMDLQGSFSAQKFTDAAEEMVDAHRLTSLVPTQLARLLDNPEPRTIAVLKRFDAILLGGARASKDLLQSSRHLGLKIFQTYGAAETSGGLVYNGTALPGVKLAERQGRILVSGPMLADGYANNPEATAEHFVIHEGARWYLTDDLGSVDGNRLSIAGRMDDVINTGGVKLSAGKIEGLLEEFFQQCLVLPVPDAQWGQSVGLAYSGPTNTQDAFEAVRQTIGSAAVPKRVRHYPSGLPMLPNGKFDRRRILDELRAGG
ncbi:AMP-binding protein [Glutamicibacter sp. 287]|uniref:AMP-binding protein n=1 Tax=unclassified Glutamicibacter TaxID=2627139 RepID=UPI000BB7E50A|nr:AMP-binding protein [Glutamicibacter sp. BW80]PCC30140.1 AMP-dependent synthetase [Glutamicibacter sp. BW80]